MISTKDQNIPEQSLDPPISKIVGYCRCCNEVIYEGEMVWMDFDENIIHDDCRTEDSKRFYKERFEAIKYN